MNEFEFDIYYSPQTIYAHSPADERDPDFSSNKISVKRREILQSIRWKLVCLSRAMGGGNAYTVTTSLDLIQKRESIAFPNKSLRDLTLAELEIELEQIV